MPQPLRLPRLVPRGLISSCTHRYPQSAFQRHQRPAYSTKAASDDAPKPKIYLSQSLDPWFNLSFEEWLFRKTDPRQVILYMYRNSPSVILGRNQNPWKEIDTKALAALNIPFIRRRSGGGTVYHDEGNTNYSVIMPRTAFDRRSNAELVAKAVRTLGVDTRVNERHDICVDGYKVSGSAFKLVNARAYHHGTMLISSRLEDLKGILTGRREGMVTKGVASVPSPVANLRRWSETVDHDGFVSAVAGEFAQVYGAERRIEEVDAGSMKDNSFVREGYQELQSWDWQYGQTPEFTYTLPLSFTWGSTDLTITSKHGRILTATLESISSDNTGLSALQKVVSTLPGLPYGEALGEMEKARGEGRMVEVWDAIKEGM